MDSSDDLKESCDVTKWVTLISADEADLPIMKVWWPDFISGEGIFDVDEDHFGQHTLGRPLADITVRRLQAVLNELSCGPATSESEREVDVALRACVALAAEVANRSDSRGRKMLLSGLRGSATA